MNFDESKRLLAFARVSKELLLIKLICSKEERGAARLAVVPKLTCFMVAIPCKWLVVRAYYKTQE